MPCKPGEPFTGLFLETRESSFVGDGVHGFELGAKMGFSERTRISALANLGQLSRYRKALLCFAWFLGFLWDQVRMAARRVSRGKFGKEEGMKKLYSLNRAADRARQPGWTWFRK